MADVGERGGEWAHNSHYPLPAGVETIRQLHWPAIGLPTQSTTQTQQLFLLLLSCFPLRPTCSAASYLMMPPPLLGVEPRSLPGGSPSNLQASSIEATLISTGPPPLELWCEEEEEKKRTLLLRNSFFFKSAPHDQTKTRSFRVRP